MQSYIIITLKMSKSFYNPTHAINYDILDTSRDFIDIFRRRVTGFYSRAKLLELNYFTILTAGQFAGFPALNETPETAYSLLYL